MAARAHRVPDGLAAVGGVEPDDVAARNHDAPHRAVREPEHALDHLVLGDLEDTRVRRLRDHRADFLLVDAAVRRLAQPEDPRHQFRRALEHPDEGRGDEGEDLHRARERGGNRFRVGQRPALRHQLADHERQKGDADDDDAVGRGVEVPRDRCEEFEAPERGSERFRELHAAVHARDHADERDVKLDRRKEARGIVKEPQRRARAPAPALAELAEPRDARGKNRELGHREQAVHENERDQDQEVRQHGAPGMPAAVILRS